ncbi:hypothetical protein MYX77_07070 [Acidobacteriia bacterium AH_259_A11_L15]|nr:hypothetical protein [Acidobacteriia bacterium AH_259_A11_L15]
MKSRTLRLLLLVAPLALVGSLLATTWAETTVVCPVSQTQNTFRVVMSYGSYIFQ